MNHLSIQFQKVHMTVSYKGGVSVLMAALLATLAACGGGGGGGDAPAAPPAAPTPTTPVATTPDAIALEATDSFTFAGYLFGDGSGTWSGGDGGDGGSGDGGGAGGDGEFIKVNMKFPFKGQATGTLTWKVLRSQYGITGNTGTLTIEKDAATNGGYKITAVNGSTASVRATQSNFFVSKSGQLSGSFPLPIGAGGSVKDVLFNGVRFADAKSTATDMSEFAGQYAYGSVSKKLASSFTSVENGVFKLNADGTGRVCGGTLTHSATCADGMDVVASFIDPAVRNVIRIKQAPTQSTPFSGGTTSNVLDMLAVMRKFGTNGGVSLTGDVVNTISGNPATAGTYTGATYASRIGAAPLDPNALIGAWNIVDRNTANSVTSFARTAIANVGGVVKTRDFEIPGGCQSTQTVLTPGPVNGTFSGGGGAFTGILLDEDSAVGVEGQNIVFIRRYSTNPTVVTGCQPF
jgi:hypothetical protein